MAGDTLSGPPPMASMGQNPAGPTPSYKGLSSQGAQPPQPQPAQPTPGSGQIGAAAVKMALEIDQALKLLAQAAPSMGPWVEQTVMGLRDQVGQAMAAGLPTNPTPAGNNMPDGSQNL